MSSLLPSSLGLILKEYFKSPYVWWGLFLFVTKKIENCFPEVEQLREYLVKSQLEIYDIHLFVIIYFALAGVATILVWILIQKEIAMYSRKDNPKMKMAIFFIVVLYMSLLAESIPVLTDIQGIIGEHNMDRIKDPNYFNFLIFANSILTLFLLPATSIFWKIKIKKTISNSLDVPIGKEMDTEKVIPRAWMFFIIFLIGIVILQNVLGCSY